ncbi:GDSL esterase/lipase [Pyrus ussuriensis x Pyrus communis]|uniref:GDSL esterase/lipase n=1 Tax=Pyrus ussuriensis x Pyrus communis TaxID=2448454 RepID=A0A5N5HTB8_9ROSA|nr:GDSL esterase/lipase [Pyrus ussuriensis x Pyrus communis]
MRNEFPTFVREHSHLISLSNQRPIHPLLNTYSPIWRDLNHDSWNNIQAPNQTFAPPPQQTPFDTSLEDTLDLLAQSASQFQQSTSIMIQEHSITLTKLEIQLGQIVQALNEQPCGDGQDVNGEQPLESSCADIHREVLEFEAFSQSSTSLEFFPKVMLDSPCCFTSLQVPSLESFGDDLLPYQEKNKLKRKYHHNQVLVEIQRTIFKVPQKKPLIPTKVWRYLDFLPP